MKVNNGANPAAFCELLCVIMSILNIKNLGLKFEPSGDTSKPWEILCFSNGYSAGDVISTRSVSAFALYVLSVPTS